MINVLCVECYHSKYPFFISETIINTSSETSEAQLQFKYHLDEDMRLFRQTTNNTLYRAERKFYRYSQISHTFPCRVSKHFSADDCNLHALLSFAKSLSLHTNFKLKPHPVHSFSHLHPVFVQQPRLVIISLGYCPVAPLRESTTRRREQASLLCLSLLFCILLCFHLLSYVSLLHYFCSPSFACLFTF